jgi:galactitol-specific phosphotransferase system IIB component
MSAVFTAAVVTIGSTVGSAVAGGFGAQTEEEKNRLKGLAGEVKQDQLDLLGDEKAQGYRQAALGYKSAQSQFSGAQRDVSMGAGTGMRNIGASADIARSQSGLATSGTIEQKVATQTGDLMAKYKSDMTKLFETKKLAQKESDLSITSTDLSYRRGEMSAEEAYQNTLSDIESQPTGFLEGMFG